MELTLLTTFDNIITANMARTKLESEGIVCFLNNENITNLLPHYAHTFGGGVRLMVRMEDYEMAKKIININSGKVTCPNCYSENIENENEKIGKKLRTIFVGLFLTGLVGNLINNYQCQECNHRFKN